MTRETQKRRERFFVEETGKLLGMGWVLEEEREHPDFILREGPRRFGLEVCEIFVGPQGSGGAAMKRTESTAHQKIETLRREYEVQAQTPLRVRILGNVTANNMATVVPALLAEDFPSRPLGHHVIIDLQNGLRLHVTKVVRPEWFRMDHRVGWVDRNPAPIIAAAIERKSQELDRYRQAAGADVRLLLVADRIQNSGKLSLEDGIRFDPSGFHTVYLFPYPEAVVILGGGAGDDR